jgi:hypothetical protein
MSNWTLKQALSELVSRFRRSGSGESSSYSSASIGTGQQAQAGDAEPEEPPVNPLALREEGTPEEWLGRFLVMLGVQPGGSYWTIAGAKHDARLISQLEALRDTAGQYEPLRLLEPGYAERLKAQDWQAWWQAEEALTRYAYSVLALALLGRTNNIGDLELMYRQEANPRIQKDAHFVLCYLLGKTWPADDITEGDFRKLKGQA